MRQPDRLPARGSHADGGMGQISADKSGIFYQANYTLPAKMVQVARLYVFISFAIYFRCVNISFCALSRKSEIMLVDCLILRAAN